MGLHHQARPKEAAAKLPAHSPIACRSPGEEKFRVASQKVADTTPCSRQAVAQHQNNTETPPQYSWREQDMNPGRLHRATGFEFLFLLKSIFDNPDCVLTYRERTLPQFGVNNDPARG